MTRPRRSDNATDMHPLHRTLACAVLALAAACGSTTPAAPKSPAELGITGFAAPAPHVFTSGQPTQEQFAKLKDVGITRIICLRAADEEGTGFEEEAAKAAGLHFVRLPVAGKDGLTRPNVETLAKELQAAGDSDTLVCCHTSNRVGAMLALKAAWIDGKPQAAAIELGKQAGMKKLEPAVVELLAK